eukprot:1804410-Pleurochrysis_carterae.AAC.3
MLTNKAWSDVELVERRKSDGRMPAQRDKSAGSNWTEWAPGKRGQVGRGTERGTRNVNASFDANHERDPRCRFQALFDG